MSTHSNRSFNFKRAYEKPARSDGWRVLVDRIWPRGVSKAEAKVAQWRKEFEPSTAVPKACRPVGTTLGIMRTGHSGRGWI